MCIQSQSAENYVCRASQVYDDEPAVGGKSLEFRLLYWGSVLASSNSKRRSSEKHDMRKQFHPQLKRLWMTRRNSIGLAEDTGITGETIAQGGEAVVPRTGSWRGLGLEKLADRRIFNGFRFVPLVTEEHHVRCSIEILFLRHEDSGNLILQGGDIDGRIKTIFDALRIPHVGELGKEDKPEDDENPFFVLLEDDKLISQINVSTEQLLLLPGSKEIRPNDAFLQIKVEIHPTEIPSEGFFFLGR